MTEAFVSAHLLSKESTPYCVEVKKWKYLKSAEKNMFFTDNDKAQQIEWV